jgi:uncharacterized delta-60 repeat protein
LILNLNNFWQCGEFTMSKNFLTRVITKASTFILISTLLTLLIVTIHASDALALDTSFSGDGKVTTSFTTPGDDVGSGIAVQADGKIVVVGTSNSGSGNSEFAVARLNDDGSLDNSFDGDGMVTTSFTTPGDDVGSGIAVQADGRVVVVGTSNSGSGNSEFAVARFNDDGSLDNSFGVGGLVTTSFSGGDDVGSGIAVQADGRVVVVGTSDNGSGASELAVARFNLDGSLDNSFSGDGRVTLSFTAGDDVGSGIAVQSDGKIVVVGTTDDLSNTWFAVARFTVNGSLDNSFGGDGTVISRSKINGDDMGSGNAVQSDDRTVVVGSSDDGSGEWRFVVARFNIDASFPDPVGSSGKAITSFSAGDDIGSGIAIQSDGRIVVVGTADDGSGDSDFAVARYNPADLSLTGGGGGGGGGCFIATAEDG